jgi:hypothetical protein
MRKLDISNAPTTTLPVEQSWNESCSDERSEVGEMNKFKPLKLGVKRETLRSLTSEELTGVAGGMATTDIKCSTETNLKCFTSNSMACPTQGPCTFC